VENDGGAVFRVALPLAPAPSVAGRLAPEELGSA
jgi:hypothetical protein